MVLVPRLSLELYADEEPYFNTLNKESSSANCATIIPIETPLSKEKLSSVKSADP